MDRVLLNVRRFRQFPGECGIAATAAIAHFFESSVDYKQARTLIHAPKDGLHTSQQGRLLNDLGFESVKIVTADLNLIDFSWSKYKKSTLLRKLKKIRTYYRNQDDEFNRDYVHDMIKWLDDERYDNNLVIDYDFKKHITKHLDRGIPVGAAVNWTALFKMSKGNRRKNGDINGEQENHAIVIRGYDDSGVFVVDSHHQYYTGKRAKYRRGYYKLPWQKFLVNIPGGDLILV